MNATSSSMSSSVIAESDSNVVQSTTCKFSPSTSSLFTGHRWTSELAKKVKSTLERVTQIVESCLYSFDEKSGHLISFQLLEETKDWHPLLKKYNAKVTYFFPLSNPKGTCYSFPKTYVFTVTPEINKFSYMSDGQLSMSDDQIESFKDQVDIELDQLEKGELDKLKIFKMGTPLELAAQLIEMLEEDSEEDFEEDSPPSPKTTSPVLPITTSLSSPPPPTTTPLSSSSSSTLVTPKKTSKESKKRCC